MMGAHEAFVSARFDALHARFRPSVGPSDVRLEAVCRVLRPLEGRSVLDLGCGKGRFARHLAARGARVVGLDLSRNMLRAATGLERVRASAARLPFPCAVFEGVVAIEVLQHLPRGLIRSALSEMRRVLVPGGRVVILDRNLSALDPHRPWLPRLAIKRIDEWRGRWMYRPSEPVRECWFWPRDLQRRMSRLFSNVRMEFLRGAKESSAVFQRVPWCRSLVCWTGEAPRSVHA